MRKPDSQSESSGWDDINTQIQQAEQLLNEIRQRLQQVQTGQGAQALLHQQQKDLQAQLNRATGASSQVQRELQVQLDQIKAQLETIEVEIESRLISWSSFREPFWQIVRFSGLGILIGVMLKSCIG